MTAPSGAALSFAALREGSDRNANGVAETGRVSDTQLLALARESHAEAFELLYSTYRARIYTYLLRLTADPEQAADLAQDTFTRAFKVLPTLGREHRVGPWLYRIAHNAAIDVLRRRKRVPWLRLGSVIETADEPHAALGHERVPERQAIEAVLRLLPTENASALLLHALEGYSYKEIADIQGCSMTAVRSRIARARAAFREHYGATGDGRRSS